MQFVLQIQKTEIISDLRLRSEHFPQRLLTTAFHNYNEQSKFLIN